jgi:phosphatidylglycerophosphatase A
MRATMVPDVIKALIVTAGGLGRLRPAPGTWGSLPPCVVVIALVLMGTPIWITHVVLAALVVLSSVGCVWLGTWSEIRYQTKDPGVVVADETAGMAIALLLVPLTPNGGPETWLTGYFGTAIIVVSAFALFRIFDITKIPPANLMQQFPAGWGILLDDIVAGLYVNVILQIFLRIAFPLLTASGESGLSVVPPM